LEEAESMTPPPSLEVVFVRAENVVGREVAGEFILVPIAARGVDLESIFHLNRVGSFIWECLDGRKNGEEIVTRVMERFDVNRVQAMDDYCRFLSQLEAIRLVARVQVERSPAMAAPDQ
jgi:hypothetical protein